MKKWLQYSFLFLVSLAISVTAIAQESEEDDYDGSREGKSITDRLVFGGNLGLGYSNGWQINAAPTVGYKITRQFIAGVGVTYLYSDFDNPFSGLRSTQSAVGGRVFGQHLLFQNIYAIAEFEYLDYTIKLRDQLDNILSESELDGTGFFVGGGYTSSFGRGLGVGIEVLYNLTYDSFNSPYASPLVIRGGLMFGL